MNAKNKHGATALQQAALTGHTEIVKTLIEAGADVNAENKIGNTALWYATKRGHPETASLLKKHGARE